MEYLQKSAPSHKCVKSFQSAPPTVLPPQVLTGVQRRVVAGLTGRFSHCIQLKDRCEWRYVYRDSDLRLVVTVFKKARPQEHVWLFDEPDVQLRTLGEVADVLLHRQQAGQTLANVRD